MSDKRKYSRQGFISRLLFISRLTVQPLALLTISDTGQIQQGEIKARP